MSVQNFQPTLEIGEAIDPIVVSLDTAETTIVPSNKVGWHYYLDGIVIAEIGGVAATFDLYLHVNGVAAAAANAICMGVAINANTIYQLPIGPLTIPDGWTLTGLVGQGDAVNVTVTGRYIVEPPAEVLQ